MDFYAAKAKLAKVMYETSIRCWLGLLVATGEFGEEYPDNRHAHSETWRAPCTLSTGLIPCWLSLAYQKNNQNGF